MAMQVAPKPKMRFLRNAQVWLCYTPVKVGQTGRCIVAKGHTPRDAYQRWGSHYGLVHS